MVDLSGLFGGVLYGLRAADPRYEIVDDVHVMDTELGLKYHLYAEATGKPYHITKDDVTVLTGNHMNPTEARILDQVAKLVTDKVAESNRAQLYALTQAPVTTAKPRNGSRSAAAAQ